MRIQSLHLIAFGPFTNTAIDLSRGKEGLHIIFGQNESGKSSSLRALHQVLYGIPTKSTDNFKHAHPDLRIGIVLKHSDNSILRVVRRKGNNKTLRKLDAENEIVDESQLHHYLGNINQATFENMFGIDHQTLVSGGEAILKGNGELGQLLFSAGAGIQDLKSVQASLEKDYLDLYTRNGSSRIINKQLSEYADAKKILRESELPNSEWERHDLSLRQAEGRKEQLNKQLNEANKNLSRLAHYRNAIPLLAERSLYDTQLLALQTVVCLPENFEDNARNALEQMLVLKREEEQDSQKIAQLNQELKNLNVPDELIERAATIESLQQKLGSHQKAAIDRQSLEPGLIEERERARACLRDLGLKDDFAAASKLRLSVQEKTRLRKLALERRALWQAFTDAQALRQRTEQRLRQCSDELVKLEQVPACEKLLVCYKRIQQDPQMEERIIAETNRIERNFKQVFFDLRKLQLKGLLDGNSLETCAELHAQLHNIVLPDNHVIDSIEKELGQLNKEIETLNSRIADISSELSEIQFRLQEHELKIAAPTESDLKEIRQLRDTGWKLVLKSWKEGMPLETAELQNYLASSNNSSELSTAYEWTLSKSDTVADRLRHEADHVAQKIQLTAQMQKLQVSLNDAKQKLAAKESRKAELKEHWLSLWSEITEKQLNPQVAKIWISQFEAQRNALNSVLEFLESSKFSIALVERSKKELEEALLDAGWSPEALSKRPLLLNLLEQAQLCLDNYRSLKQSQSELEKELSKLQIDLANNTATEQARKSEIDSWAFSWQPAVEGLGLSATTSPEELTAFLDRLEQFFSHFDQISNLKRRIAGIDRDAEQFCQDVKETIDKLSLAELKKQLNKLSSEEASLELFNNLKKAKEMSQRRQMLQERRAELVETETLRRASLEKLKDRLKQMMTEAQVSSEGELLEAAKQSNEKRRLQELVDSYNRQLVRLSEGSSLEAYLKECQSLSAEELDIEIKTIQEENKTAELERDELQLSIGREKQILQSMDGAANAAEASLRLQQILAELGQDVEHYLRLRMASIILKKSIDRYREKNQSPILRKASDIFARLSNGSFSGLQEDFNEKGEPVLFGVRADASTLTAIEGMSEGTCDQVYLALRLAGLSLYLEKEEALPFIVDDILVNFDDQRSLATLRVLAELSKRTQIIMFTHHAHIVDLAKEHLDPDLFFVTGLGESSASYPLNQTMGPIPVL